MSSPFHTYAGLVQRATHLVHVFLHNSPDVVGYQFWGHRTVDDAYGNPLNSGVGGAGPVAMFQVPRGQSYRSDTLRRKGLGLVEENRRGTTHALYDVDDFLAPAVGGSPIPHDGGWMFLRAQEQRNAGLLQDIGVAETTITLTGVLAGDVLVIKGIYFDFQAGGNNLAFPGTQANPFIIGLGADDNAAAANLTLALNNGAVRARMNFTVPNGFTAFATNVGAPSAVVLVQPWDGAATVSGVAYEYAISTTAAARVIFDATSLEAGALVAPITPFLGPIYCIPPVAFFGTREPSFTLQAIAPSSTASAAGALPDLDEDLTSIAPRAMCLVFPKPLTALSIRNLSAVNLLVSFGPEQMMRNVPAGGELPLYSGQTKEVCLACPDGVAGAAFTLHGVVTP